MDALVEPLRLARTAIGEAQRDLSVLRRAQEQPGSGTGAPRVLLCAAQERQAAAVRLLDELALRCRCLAVARHRMVPSAEIANFAKRAGDRLLLARALRHWSRRAIALSIGRQLRRTHKVVAARMGRWLRVRYFYRWRLRQLRSATMAERERAEALEAERRELKMRETFAAQDETRRVQQAMDEMAHEFSHRTAAHERQHAELLLGSVAREAVLVGELAAAEFNTRIHAQRAGAERAQCAEFAARAAAWANSFAITAQGGVEKKAYVFAKAAGHMAAAAALRADALCAQRKAVQLGAERERLLAQRRADVLEQQLQCMHADSLRFEELCARSCIGSEEADGRRCLLEAQFAAAQRIAHAEVIHAMEQTQRAWVCTSELQKRTALTSCANTALAQQQRTDSDKRFSEIGQIAVLYCARNAMSRWRGFVERQRAQRRLTRVVLWFSAAVDPLCAAYEAKTRLFAVAWASHTLAEKHMWRQENAANMRAAEALTDRVLDNFTNTAAMWSGAHGECLMSGAKAIRISQSHSASASMLTAESGSDEGSFGEELPEHCTSRDTGSGGLEEIVAGLKEPLWSHGRKGSLPRFDDNTTLEEAMSVVSEERAGLAERARVVVDVTRFTAAEALEMQHQRYDEEIEELLRYQQFLENRIIGRKVVYSGRQTPEGKDTKQSMEELLAYQNFLEQKIAGVHRIDSGTQTDVLDRKGVHQDEGLCTLNTPLEAIQRQKRDDVCPVSPQAEQPVTGMLQARDQKATAVAEALVEAAQQYRHVLCAMERDVEARHTAFFSERAILADVGRLSEAVMSHSKSDTESVSALDQWIAGEYVSDLQKQLGTARQELRTAREEIEEMRERLAFSSTFAATIGHGAETAARVRTPCSTCQREETNTHDLDAEVDPVGHETCDAQSCHESAGLLAQLEFLRTTIDRNNADFEVERQHLVDEANALRRQIMYSGEQSQRIIAESRENGASEMDELRAEVQRLHAEAETSRLYLDASVVSARRLQKEIDAFVAEGAVAVCRRVSQCVLSLAGHWTSVAADSLDTKLDALLNAVATSAPAAARGPEQCFLAQATAALLFFAEAVTEVIDAKMAALVSACSVALHAVGTADRLSQATHWTSALSSPPAQERKRILWSCDRGGSPQHSATPISITGDVPFSLVTPPRQVIRMDDVSQSMQRYSRMLDEQLYRNDSRVQKLGFLVMEVDNLIEHGRAVSRLEGSLVKVSPEH